MSRGFSLGGASFAFHCVSPPERLELASLLLRNNGALFDAADERKPDSVYVITSYWADCKPRPAGFGVLLPLLAQPIHNAQELAARLQLMALSDPRRRFNCLEYALNELLTLEEQAKFFKDVLPEMVRLVLAMPQMFATPPPLLTPLEVGDEVDSDAASIRMFSAPGNMSRMVVLKGQKIRCLLQYFLRVVPRAISDRGALSAEVVDFTRVDAPLHPRLFPARYLDKHLQIDFANKFAGGGVLNSGCVQEEIRFMLSPELLVSCLVFAKLEPHEAFAIHGTERYCTYQGYGGSFVYGGNFDDMTQLVTLPDGRLRRKCVIVGIDATDYGSARVERQYTRGHVWRDLVKAYAGFAYPDAHDGERCWPVATGNWGCGVFRGDRELKFLIQWLAASLRRRELVYVLFEQDLDLLAKVEPLLTLATSPRVREWDRQSAGLTQWLMGFLFDELSVGRGMREDKGVLTRASLSLEQALGALYLPDEQQQEPEVKQKPQQPESSPQASSSATEPMEKSSISPALHEEHAEGNSEGLKKKPKTTKELHQKTMQDFFSQK
uniref:PARG catalytic Macro domain-containing protein n=1 Tax=Phytophthora ramorum TaxID=164328 RepID=H3HE74_PHYRM